MFLNYIFKRKNYKEGPWFQNSRVFQSFTWFQFWRRPPPFANSEAEGISDRSPYLHFFLSLVSLPQGERHVCV